MEENLYAPPKSNLADFVSSDSIGLYSPRQIYTASFVGGPFAAAWFISHNFRLLSEDAAARRALIIGAAVVLCIFPLALVLPNATPRVVVPLTYSYPFYFFAKRRFEVNANSGIHFVGGWSVWLKVIGASLLWIIPAVLIWGAGALAAAWLFPKTFPL